MSETINARAETCPSRRGEGCDGCVRRATCVFGSSDFLAFEHAQHAEPAEAKVGEGC